MLERHADGPMRDGDARRVHQALAGTITRRGASDSPALARLRGDKLTHPLTRVRRRAHAPPPSGVQALDALRASHMHRIQELIRAVAALGGEDAGDGTEHPT